MSSRGGRTHHEVLGVAPDATPDEVQAAFRARVRSLHPDLHPEWSASEIAAAEAALIEVVSAASELRRTRVDEPQPADGRTPTTTDGASAGRLPLDDRVARTWSHGSGWPQAGDFPDPPPGFRLAGSMPVPPFLGRRLNLYRGGFDVMADALNSGVSLEAMQPDLSALRSYEPDGVWRLRCDRVPVTDDQLANLRGMVTLRELSLATTKITDAGLRHIVELPQLRVLDLWGTAITDSGLREITRSASTLDRLNLGRTAITDAGLTHLRYMHTLDELNLRGTRVRGPGLAHLHGLVTLDRLSLPRRVGGGHRRRLAAALPRLQIL